jgi:hypothetical protein
MPNYLYKDEQTGTTKEVFHSMAECDNPSESTLAEITHEGRVMHRIPHGGGVFLEFGSMSPERKKQVLHERSQGDFKKNIAGRKEQMLKDAYGR